MPVNYGITLDIIATGSVVQFILLNGRANILMRAPVCISYSRVILHYYVYSKINFTGGGSY